MVDPSDFDFYEKFQKPNYSGFVVIGAGLPRTGTTAIRHALGVLLDGRSYHGMYSAVAGGHPELNFWNRALDNAVKKDEWVSFLQGRGYRACSDFPSTLFYK